MALLTNDVFISMPPLPLEYRGLAAASRFFAPFFRTDRTVTLRATPANGQPAFGYYLRDVSGLHNTTGLFVLAFSGERICAITASSPGVLR